MEKWVYGVKLRHFQLNICPALNIRLLYHNNYDVEKRVWCTQPNPSYTMRNHMRFKF